MLGEKSAASLLAKAREARKRAYSRHKPKRIKVGAALLTSSGRVFQGCNISNDSSTLGMCAERVAVYAAVAQGYTAFKAIAVVGSGKEPWTPCGACRQTLHQFDPSGRVEVLMSDANGKKVLRMRMKDLYPMPFKISE